MWIFDAHSDQIVASIGLPHRAPQSRSIDRRITGRLKIGN
jgi:hypothetical protein